MAARGDAEGSDIAATELGILHMAGEELEAVLDVVWEELSEISLRWTIFLQLFDSGPANIKLLNDSGSLVFDLFQRLMFWDAVLRISRLTDPSGNGHNAKGSVKTLVKIAKPKLCNATFNLIEAKRESIQSQATNIREHRNKILAHNNLAIGSGHSSLSGVTYDEVEDSIKALKELVALVAYKSCGRRLPFDLPIPSGCDGKRLLKILERAHSHN